MIVEYRTLIPFIDFGFGYDTKTAAIGEPVTVWLNTIYNPGYSSFISYDTTKASMVKISEYEYQLTYTEAGTHEIFIDISARDKALKLTSNTITLTVE